MAVYTQPGGAGTKIIVTGLGVTSAGIAAAFPADFVDNGNFLYEQGVLVEVGNGVTDTEWDETRAFCLNLPNLLPGIDIKTNATVTWGSKTAGNYSNFIGLVKWICAYTGVAIAVNGGTLNCYGIGLGRFDSSTHGGIDIISGGASFIGCNISYGFNLLHARVPVTIKRCNISSAVRAISLNATPVEISDVVINDLTCVQKILRAGVGNITAENLIVSDSDNAIVDMFSHNVISLKNCSMGTYTKFIQRGSGKIQTVVTFDLNISDSDNTAIQTASVVIKNVQGDTVFSKTTDASGDITQCDFIAEDWTGISETYVNHNPFTVTISKAGLITDSYDVSAVSDGKVGVTHERTLYAIQESIDIASSDPTWTQGLTLTDNNDGSVTLNYATALANVEGYAPQNVHYEVYVRQSIAPELTSAYRICRVVGISFVAWGYADGTAFSDGDMIYFTVKAVDDLQTENTTVSTRSLTISITDVITDVQINNRLGSIEDTLSDMETDITTIKRRRPIDTTRDLRAIKSRIADIRR